MNAQGSSSRSTFPLLCSELWFFDHSSIRPLDRAFKLCSKISTVDHCCDRQFRMAKRRCLDRGFHPSMER